MATLKIKVPVALGGFKENQRIAGEDISNYIILAFNSENPDEQTELNADAITDILDELETDKAPGSEEWFADVFAAMTDKDSGETEGSEATLSGDLQSAVDKIAKDDDINDEVDSIVLANAKLQTGSVFMFEQINKLLTAEEKACIPYPGSDTGNNPDRVTIPRIVNGERREVKGSVINTMIAQMPRIKDIDKALAEVSTEEGVELTTDQRAQRDNLRADRVAAVRGYRRALAMLHVAALFENSRFLSFEVEPADKQGNRKLYCCAVINKHKQREGRNLTVSKFIGLTGITADTTFAKFLDMLKRKTKKKDANTPTAEYEIPTASEVEPFSAALAHALDDNATFTSLLNTMKATDGDKGETANLMIGTLAMLEDKVADLLDKVGRKRVGDVMKAQEEPNKAAA